MNNTFLQNLPKAELHVHLEGTMQPELLLAIAERNRIALPYATLEQAKEAYQFTDYATFLHRYFLTMQALRTEQDFYDITWAYLQSASSQAIKHLEISFDLQSYQPRIQPGAIINGIYQALQDGQKHYNISGLMIICLIRDLSEASAFQTLEATLPFRDKITGVGLASLEIGHPAAKFMRVFKKAREYGYRLTAHAELSGPQAIWNTINHLNVERIDHGTCASEDQELIDILKQKDITLTVCPISNIRLGIYSRLEEHPLKRLIEADLKVTINSDDPAFFKASLVDNFIAATNHIALTKEQIVYCAQNSFEGSFANPERKQACLKMIDQYLQAYNTKL